MPSELLAIYDAIAALDIAIDGSVIPVDNLSGLRPSVPSSDLPRRVLHPYNGRLDGSSGFPTLGLDPISTAQWVISDLFLLCPQGQSDIADLTPDLVQYMAVYADAVRHIRCPTDLSAITSVRFRPGLDEYPQGSGVRYFTVTVALTIEEIFN